MPQRLYRWLKRTLTRTRGTKREDTREVNKAELEAKLRESLAFVDLLEQEDAVIYAEIVKGKRNGTRQ